MSETIKIVHKSGLTRARQHQGRLITQNMIDYVKRNLDIDANEYEIIVRPIEGAYEITKGVVVAHVLVQRGEEYLKVRVIDV